MTQNSNLSVIPFYNSLEEQDFRKWYAYGRVFPLPVSRHHLVPFFAIIPTAVTSISKVELYKLCCNNNAFILEGDYNLDFSEDFKVYYNGDEQYWESLFSSAGLEISTIDTYKVLSFVPTSVNLNLAIGMYFLKITFDEGTEIYSDVFKCVTDAELSKLTTIEWSCREDVSFSGGLIPYGTKGFFNRVYLDTDIGMPSYEFEEEGQERLGYFFPIKQISYKKFNFAFYAPEYLCDAMRLIRLSDNIVITDSLNREYSATQFLMEVDWLEQGHYAGVKAEFTTDTVVKAIAKSFSTT